MNWSEVVSKRGTSSKTFFNSELGTHRFESILGTVLHVDGVDVDMAPVRRDDGVLDGWEVTKSGWHYRIGRRGGIGSDGWIGFGGRKGQHWIYSRLVRVGYLHYPTRSWQDVGGPPSYVRGDLTSENRVVSVGPSGANVDVTALSSMEWRNLWTTPGAGEVYARWRVEGKKLKEEIVVNQASRMWVQNNAPPLTPAASTYFGFVFQLDLSDIPRITKGGAAQDINGDFDDDDGSSNINIETAAQELLGFLPASSAYSVDGMTQIKLRKRIWRDADTNTYLLVGAKVSDISSIAGDIIFDPTYQIQPDSSTGIDTRIFSSSPTVNDGNSTLLTVSTSGKLLNKFDLTPITADSVVSATVAYTTNGVSISGSCSMGKIKTANSSWTELGATWNTTNGSTSWAGSAGCSTSGTDYESTLLGTWTSTGTGGTPVVDTVTLSNSAVLDWIQNPSNNIGMIGFGGSATGTNYNSCESGTPSRRPLLTIEYTSGGVFPHHTARRLTGGMPVGMN